MNALWPGTLPDNVPEKFRVTPLETRLMDLLWPAERVLSRGDTILFPYYTPTLFTLLARKKPFLAIRTLLGILFPPKSWVAESFNVPPGSPRILLHYAERLYRPFQLIVRQWLGGK